MKLNYNDSVNIRWVEQATAHSKCPKEETFRGKIEYLGPASHAIKNWNYTCLQTVALPSTIALMGHKKA